LRAAREWSLGAVLAETAVDPFTHLLVVRPEISPSMGRDLERRLLGHRLAGCTSLIVVVAGRDRISGALISALRRAQRKIGSRNGRLSVTAETSESRRVLECAGFDVIDIDGDMPLPERLRRLDAQLAGGPPRSVTEISR